jgi:hypothetical protein
MQASKTTQARCQRPVLEWLFIHSPPPLEHPSPSARGFVVDVSGGASFNTVSANADRTTS